MAEDNAFVDFYELLRVSPGAEIESIQRVHRALAARYHPDNMETGDLERFLRVNDAFKILSDPEKRKEFDTHYKIRKENPMPIFLTKEFTEGVDGEVNRRIGTALPALYPAAHKPGVPGAVGTRNRADDVHPARALAVHHLVPQSQTPIIQDDRSAS